MPKWYKAEGTQVSLYMKLFSWRCRQLTCALLLYTWREITAVWLAAMCHCREATQNTRHFTYTHTHTWSISHQLLYVHNFHNAELHDTVRHDEPTTLFTSPGFTLYRMLQLVLYNSYYTIIYITTVIYATDWHLGTAEKWLKCNNYFREMGSHHDCVM